MNKIIRISTITFFLVFTCAIALAQNAEGVKRIQEIKKELVEAKADTNQIWSLVDLCTAYQWTNIDSLNYYSKKGLELSKKLKFPKGEVRILNSLGISNSFHGNIPVALDTLFKALRIAEKHQFPLETAVCLNNIGCSYFFLGDSQKSLDYIKRAQAINEYINDLSPRDLYWKIYIQFWLGTDYLDLGQLNLASQFLGKAYQNAFNPQYVDLYSVRPTILMYYGKLYFKLGDFEKALSYLHQSIAIYDVYQDPFGTADACYSLAQFFQEKDQPDSLIYYAKKGLNAAIKFDYQPGILNNSRILAAQYEHIDPKQALTFTKMELAAKDSLYGAKKIQELQKTLSEEQQREQQILNAQTEKQNQLKQNTYLGGLGVLLIIAFILFRNNLQRKKANILLHQQKNKIESTLTELKSAQAQLIQSEKMASLGELTAGIAHEIQNPLNFVNNFSEVSSEMIDELKEEMAKGDLEEANAISDDLKQNLEKISLHGKRASGIVKGMLEHSRTSSGQKELTDINALADEYLKLAYHGLRAKDKSFNADMKTDFDESLPKVAVVPQDFGRVLLNLINNAFYAVNEKQQNPLSPKREGAESYKPSVTISTKNIDGKVEITISDNGNGIPRNIIDKIFQPFFTTKPTGKGTGLGLSLAYDIVKAHGGDLKVESKEGEGTTFLIYLPIK